MPLRCDTDEWFVGQAEDTQLASAFSGVAEVALVQATAIALSKAWSKIMAKYNLPCPDKCPNKIGLFSVHCTTTLRKTKKGLAAICVFDWLLVVSCAEDGNNLAKPSGEDWAKLNKKYEESENAEKPKKLRLTPLD